MMVIGFIGLACIACFLGGRYIAVDSYEHEIRNLRHERDTLKATLERLNTPKPPWPKLN
jgi:hypothetical protein